MKRPFREYHLLQILSAFDKQTLPLDVFLRNYFRAHKAVGSKDRKEICDCIYGMLRWRGLLDFLSGPPFSWENRLETFQRVSLEKTAQDCSIPSHIRVSFPKAFYQFLVDQLGSQKAFEFCLSSNQPAPTTIRVNTLKISRQELIEKWQNQFSIAPCQYSSAGIRFKEKINFFGLQEFKAGYFEIQDEASQLVADLVAIQPGQHFLDYCAGSGGKSLAIAPKMKARGQLYLHDIRPFSLLEAKKRLKRAGIQNAQILLPDSPNKATLKGKMDWVLVDAPCSGTGTLRRNPDMKWKFDDKMVERLRLEQKQIFEDAFSFLKPGGHIVYATCSVLPRENEQQADDFLSQFPIEQIGTPFASFPVLDEMDGFFGVVFKKKKD